MAKIKYKFNPESLSFDRIELSNVEHFYKNILPRLATTTILSVICFLLLSFFLDSPKEQNLIRENRNLVLKYEVLTKSIAEKSKILEEIQSRDDRYRAVFEAKDIPESIRHAGFGGTNRYKKFEKFPNSRLLINSAQSIDLFSKQLVVQSKSFDEIINLVQNKEKMLACLPAIQPISMKDLRRFGSPFGYRLHPIYKVVKMHTGIDLTAPRGTKVYASGDGIVSRIQNIRTGYGKSIIIDHGYSYKTLYAHLSKINVNEGDKVKRGDIIGYVGNTGTSTCDHLHYEVRKNNRPQNPVNYYYNDLSKEDYERLIANPATNTHSFED